MPTGQAAGTTVPPQVALIFGVIWFLFMAGIVTSYIVMLFALWKGMRAHQKIAVALTQIAEKLKAQ